MCACACVEGKDLAQSFLGIVNRAKVQSFLVVTEKDNDTGTDVEIFTRDAEKQQFLWL